jgi:isocitrate/isopropylmalate dehydrogenase
MPEMFRFVVTEKRSVEVTASSQEDAARIAAAAFEHGQDVNGKVTANDKTNDLLVGVWGNTTKHIRKESILVERK